MPLFSRGKQKTSAPKGAEPAPQPPAPSYEVGAQALIPCNIHMIWVGIVVPPPQVFNFCKWAVENPDYDCYLWTETHSLDATAELLVQTLKDRHDVVDVEAELMVDFYYIECELITTRVLQIYVKSISTLPHISDRGLMYEEMYTWKNYGAASDILRIWILHHMGGIYMDFDTYSADTPMQVNILAPRGILFGVCEDLPMGSTAPPQDVIVNAVIAAPKGANELKQIAKMMDRRYQAEYKTLSPGHQEFTEQAHERWTEINRLREVIKANPTAEDIEDTKWDLRDQMEYTTILRSGPLLVRQWLEHDRAIYPWSPDIELYYFQKAARYQLRIESENTWIK